MSDGAADTAAVMTDEVRSWIGRATDLMPLPEEVSASDVRRYVEATGDINPLWCDEATARSAGYRGKIVPPILVIELGWRLKNADNGRIAHNVPLPPQYIDTRNAGVDMEWLEPVYVGDRISIRHRIRDISARPGRRGLGVYITRETEYFNGDGTLVARMLQTIARFPKAQLETN